MSPVLKLRNSGLTKDKDYVLATMKEQIQREESPGMISRLGTLGTLRTRACRGGWIRLRAGRGGHSGPGMTGQRWKVGPGHLLYFSYEVANPDPQRKGVPNVSLHPGCFPNINLPQPPVIIWGRRCPCRTMFLWSCQSAFHTTNTLARKTSHDEGRQMRSCSCLYRILPSQVVSLLET